MHLRGQDRGVPPAPDRSRREVLLPLTSASLRQVAHDLRVQGDLPRPKGPLRWTRDREDRLGVGEAPRPALQLRRAFDRHARPVRLGFRRIRSRVPLGGRSRLRPWNLSRPELRPRDRGARLGREGRRGPDRRIRRPPSRTRSPTSRRRRRSANGSPTSTSR